MRHSMLRALPLMAPVLLLLGPDDALARKRVPPLITQGEAIKHLADVPDDRKPEARRIAGIHADIGYRHQHVGVLWLDLWSWDGEYCLYQGTSSWDLTPSQAASLLGISQAELRKPILYSVPIGLVALLITGGTGLALVGSKRSNKADFDEVMTDPRYLRAWEILHEEEGNVDEAVEYLGNQGIAREQAIRRLCAMKAVLEPSAPPPSLDSAGVMAGELASPPLAVAGVDDIPPPPLALQEEPSARVDACPHCGVPFADAHRIADNLIQCPNEDCRRLVPTA